jgi:hypothetical protein
VLDPHHLITLLTRESVTSVRDSRGEAEPGRALGEDTLQRCRRVLGPDHPITLYLAQVAVTAAPLLGDDAAEDDQSPPRC